MAVRVQIARIEFEKRTAEDWVLVRPRPIREPGLEKASKVGVDPIDRRRLICLEHVLPIPRSLEVLVPVASVSKAIRHQGNTKIIIRILNSPRHTARSKPDSPRVNVILRDVAKILPARQTTAPFYVPIVRFNFCVFDDRLVGCGPVDVNDSFQIGFCNEYICVGATLCVSFAEGHPAVWQVAFAAIDVD